MVTKLCPFRLMAFYSEGKTVKPPRMEVFAPCVQAKCAMWREATHMARKTDTPDARAFVVGYCGLAGRPW